MEKHAKNVMKVIILMKMEISQKQIIAQKLIIQKNSENVNQVII